MSRERIVIKVDGKKVTTLPGVPLIEVIRESGVEVPSMCYLTGEEHFTSCMVCVVKERESGKLIPSCSLPAREGMDILSEDPEVTAARQASLELLLSEHVGDCEAPCQVTCPAHMNIPLMNRLLAAGRDAEALEVVRRDIALPAVFGRVCPAPCEGACHRKPVDAAVSICLLKRYAGDHGLAAGATGVPKRMKSTGKSVSVIGAGPAGLAAAWHLALRGHGVTVYDRNPVAGGSLLSETTPEQLPREVLQAEVDLFAGIGVEFRPGTEVGGTLFREISGRSDAVVIAAGKGESGLAEWDLPGGGKAERNYRIAESPFFAAGSARKPSRLAIRALGEGKEASWSVDQFLRGEEVTGEPFLFNSRFGRLAEPEFAEYLKDSVPGERLEPAQKGGGLTEAQVRSEAARCMHCDCRDLDTCKLRIYSDQYQARQKRFRSGDRLPVVRHVQHESVVYEPGKCIKCGICVRLTEKHREAFGMTFIGRGFEVVVDVPFHGSPDKGLQKVALEVADACPTGAISRKGGP